jgi:hypothetical protein
MFNFALMAARCTSAFRVAYDEKLNANVYCGAARRDGSIAGARARHAPTF